MYLCCYPCCGMCQTSETDVVDLTTRLLDIELDSITWNATVPFIPPITNGKVLKICDDGDTIVIATVLPFQDVQSTTATVYRFPVKLAGIDCIELKGNTFCEKEFAIKACNALADKILGKVVTLKNVSFEKYGRILADVYLDGIHLNRWMLDKGYAVNIGARQDTEQK